MEKTHIYIRVRGREKLVRAASIGGRTIVVSGACPRIAEVMDEEFVEGEAVPHPERFVPLLKGSKLGMDIFTFAERPPQLSPRHGYPFEWDNWAVLPITTFNDWWEKRLPQESRKNVRKSKKLGVTVSSVPFDDELVAGIQHIYNETSVRQGKRFWHFGKSLEAVNRMNETYLQRSDFIGAYLGCQLVGFIKIVHVDRVAMLMQILALSAHQDKRPMNALLAHAVELCVERGSSLLVYGKYVYNNRQSSLTEFKRRNGFEQVNFPRYYVPLTVRGRIAITLGLHRGLGSLIPSPATAFLLRWRSRIYRVLS